MSWSAGDKITAAKLNTLEDAATSSACSSYTIFQDTGSTYYAKANIVGGTSYGGSGDAGGVTGTNCSAVIQAAINALTDGGKIFIKAGTYDVLTALTITDKNVFLEGEGCGQSPPSKGTVLYKKFNGDLLTVTYTIAATGGFVIRDMGFRSDKDTYTGAGIVVTGAHTSEGWLLENLRVRGFDDSCIKMTDTGKHTLRKIYVSLSNNYAIYSNNCGDGQWYDVEADWGYNPYGGAYIKSSIQIFGGHFEGYYGIYFDNCVVEMFGVKVYGCKYHGIYAPNGGQYKIFGSVIADSNQDSIADGAGIRLINPVQAVILGNRITDSSSKMIYGIYQSGGSAANNRYIVNVITGGALTQAIRRTVTASNLVIYDMAFGHVQDVEHHTAADTLTIAESGSVHTNLGAGGNIKLTLPQDAVAGHAFEFAVMTAGQELQVDAGAAGAIYINGVKSADNAYIWADDEGESVKLVADGNGDWIALYTQGTWTVV